VPTSDLQRLLYLLRCLQQRDLHSQIQAVRRWTVTAATGGVPMNEKHSWLYLPETDIDRDALYLIACSYVWKRGGDIEAGWELVRSLGEPQPLLQTIAEVGLVKAGVRSIALLETALTSGQLHFDVCTSQR